MRSSVEFTAAHLFNSLDTYCLFMSVAPAPYFTKRTLHYVHVSSMTTGITSPWHSYVNVKHCYTLCFVIVHCTDVWYHLLNGAVRQPFLLYHYTSTITWPFDANLIRLIDPSSGSVNTPGLKHLLIFNQYHASFSTV